MQNNVEFGCNQMEDELVLVNRERLPTHKLVDHHGERPFKCDNQGCEKSYRNAHHLRRHKVTKHSFEKDTSQQVICGADGCGKIYCNKYTLKEHLLKVHTSILIPSEECKGAEIQYAAIVKPIFIKKKCDIEKRHVCEVPGCDAAFKRPYRLKYHTLTFHGGEKPFKCELDGCDKKYTSNSHLKRHRLLIHSTDITIPEMVMICQVEGCGKIYSNQYNLKRHMAKNHSDVPFACKEIKIEESDGSDWQEIYTDSAEYYTDKETTETFTGTEPSEVTTNKETPDITTDKRTLEISTVKESPEYSTGKETTGKEEETTDKEAPGMAIMCEIEGCVPDCNNEKIKIEESQNKDIKIKIEEESQDEYKEMKIEEVQIKIENPYIFEQYVNFDDVQDQYRCREPGCYAKFTRSYRLENHKLARHSNERPLKCVYESCGKTYRNAAHLARHRAASHLTERDATKQIICEIGSCGRIYFNRYSLKKHVSRNHTNLLPFSCADCGEKFKRKGRLRVHRRETHKIEAPYKCNYCPKEFAYYCSLDRHLEHHKMHQCDCEKTFAKWSELSGHRRTECTVPRKEHKCEICGKSFPFKQNLIHHFRLVHLSNDRNHIYQCPSMNCKKSYKYTWNLDYHIKSCHGMATNQSEAGAEKFDEASNKKYTKVKKRKVTRKFGRTGKNRKAKRTKT